MVRVFRATQHDAAIIALNPGTSISSSADEMWNHRYIVQHPLSLPQDQDGNRVIVSYTN